MKLIAVHSTMIKAAGYDGSTCTLVIEFANGDHWSYAGVSPLTYKQMMEAPSIGTFFARAIKPKHTGTKLETLSEKGGDENFSARRNPEPTRLPLVVLDTKPAAINVSLAPSVKQALDLELEDAAKITLIDSPQTCEAAQKSRSILKGWRLSLTKEEAELKAPVKEVITKIQEAYTPPLEDVSYEETRLGKMIGEYVLQQQRQADQEKKAQEDRLKEGQQKASELLAKAEEKKADAREAEMLGDTEGARAANIEASSLNLFAAEAQEETAPRPVTVAPKIKVKIKLGFKVIGENEAQQQRSLRLFAAKHPDLVKIEPRTALINAALNSGSMESAPGLEIVEELKTGSRRLPSQRLIEG